MGGAFGSSVRTGTVQDTLPLASSAICTFACDGHLHLRTSVAKHKTRLQGYIFIHIQALRCNADEQLSGSVMTYLATRQRGPTTSAPSDGSRTITLRDDQPREEGDEDESHDEGDDNRYTVGVLRLRGGPSTRGRVQWAEDTVDNEGMGKKKSKSACL